MTQWLSIIIIRLQWDNNNQPKNLIIETHAISMISYAIHQITGGHRAHKLQVEKVGYKKILISICKGKKNGGIKLFVYVRIA